MNLTDDFFTDDDAYIVTLIEAAEGAVANDIDRPLKECIDPVTRELFASLRHAILMLIGSAYSYRESVTVQNVKNVSIYEMLISPFRKQSIG